MRGTFMSALNPLTASTLQQLKKLGGDRASNTVMNAAKFLGKQIKAHPRGFRGAASDYFAGKRMAPSGRWIGSGKKAGPIRQGVFGGTAAWAGLNLLDPDSTTAGISRRGMELGIGYGLHQMGSTAAIRKFGAAAIPYSRGAGIAMGGLFAGRMLGLI